MRFHCILIATACICTAAQLRTQSIEIQEVGRPHLTFREAMRGFIALNTPIDSAAITEDTTVKQVIAEIYDQLAKRNLETSWLVDGEPARRDRPGLNFYNARIKLTGLPKQVTPASLMKEVFAQTRCTDFVVVIRAGGYFEVTSQKKINREPLNDVDSIRALAVSPDSKTAATASDSGIWLWDLASGKKKHFAKSEEGYWSIAFSPDGNALVGSGWEPDFKQWTRIWSLAEGKEIKKWRTSDTGGGHAYSADGRTLFTAVGSHLVKAWDLKTAKVIRQFGEEPIIRGGDNVVRTSHLKRLILSPDGKTVGAYGAYGPQLWKTDTGEEIRLKGEMVKLLPPLLFTPDGKLVALRRPQHDEEGGGKILVWDLASRTLHKTYQKEDVDIRTFAQSANGKYLAVVGKDNSLRLWETASGKELHVVRGGGGRLLAFTPNGRFLAVTSGNQTTLVVRDISPWVKEK